VGSVKNRIARKTALQANKIITILLRNCVAEFPARPTIRRAILAQPPAADVSAALAALPDLHRLLLGDCMAPQRSNSMPRDPDPNAAQRRRAMRFPAQVASVRVLGICDAALILNESHTGIAIVVDNATPFVLDQCVSVDYEGAPLPAVVRRIAPQENGAHLIGLEWR
jgi:hypothetical protein